MKLIISIIIFTFLGLLIGYLLFAKVNGAYIDVKALLFGAKNFFENIGQKIAGFGGIRQNILIVGLIGAVLGLGVGLVVEKKGKK